MVIISKDLLQGAVDTSNGSDNAGPRQDGVI